MKTRPTQSRKGVKGQLPLAGSRDSVPCGVWGNAPTVPRPTNPKEAVNKGAGSEASLPVTLRVRRRAPKLLFPQDSVMNQNCAVLPQPKSPAAFTTEPLCALITPCQRSPAHPQSCGRPSPSPQRGQASGTDGGQSDPDAPRSTCGCSRSSPDECRSRC